MEDDGVYSIKGKVEDPEKERRDAECREADAIYSEKLADERERRALAQEIWKKERGGTDVHGDIGYVGGNGQPDQSKPVRPKAPDGLSRETLRTIDSLAMGKSAKDVERRTGVNPLDEMRKRLDKKSR